MEFLLPSNVIPVFLLVHILTFVTLMAYLLMNNKQFSKGFIVVSLLLSFFLPIIGALGIFLLIIMKRRALSKS